LTGQQSQAKRNRSEGSSSSIDEQQNALHNMPVEVNQGNGFIEVVSSQLRKEKLI
jgi:Trehalose-phosphatase